MPQDANYSPPLTRSQIKLRSCPLLAGIETVEAVKRITAKKKRQPLQQLAMQHNENKNLRDESSENEVKKIRISEEEMKMNGAPEGDLFDITVKSDAELLQLTSIENPAIAYHDALNRTSEVWADQFNDVETIRRIVLQHPDLITPDNNSLKCIELALSAANSLRSCHIRNGLLCLNGLYSLPSLCGAHSEVLGRLLIVLLTKSTVGPRFMLDIANNTLNTVAHAYPMNTLVESLRVHLTHRSAELSNKCILLMCSAMAKQNTDITTSMLTALHDCIANAKRPAGREAVKQCLISLRGGVGADALDGRIDELVSSTQAQNLKLEIAKLNNSVASKPTTSSELRRTFSGFGKFPRPVVATKSAPDLKIVENN